MRNNMKVNRTSGVKRKSNTKAVKATEKPRITFSEILGEKEYDQQKEKLEELLSEIDDKGQELAENRTVETLYAYKEMIQDFIEEAVHKGLKMQERRGFSRAGRTKVLRTVSAIDAKILELTDLIIQRESKELKILSKVGEIKGLLVNIIL